MQDETAYCAEVIGIQKKAYMGGRERYEIYSAFDR